MPEEPKAPEKTPEQLYEALFTSAKAYNGAKAALYDTIPPGSCRVFQTGIGTRVVYATTGDDGKVRYTDLKVIGTHDVRSLS